VAYWDTSCLLKLYAPEADSLSFKAHALHASTLTTADITRLELFAALRRKEAAGDLHNGGARLALSAYDADVAAGLIAVTGMNRQIVERFEEIIERSSSQAPPIMLRTLDAIHLAAAIVSGESEVVATDKRLREAAISLGLAVYPPP